MLQGALFQRWRDTQRGRGDGLAPTPTAVGKIQICERDPRQN